ncbi:amidohydrolase family protein [Streptomyces sp. GMR22]|uniref:amidohydrolase family protein n=1 Tax=Streptomyces sp. GMR22 TaxID=2759524 RepID=UPI0015FCDBDA|nr:amidohydrolase family protein [Streptomyces sp. GMR22]MBA6436983.1 amidohydrolase family protein [Streptomyces sp. GMR22]
MSERIIDIHSHFLPSWYAELARTAGHAVPDGMPGWPAWNVDDHLGFMDERCIARSLLSLSSPGVALGGSVDPEHLARRVNEAGAAVVADHPARFGLLASLPLPDVDAALAELERSVDHLGAEGVILSTHALGTYVADGSHDVLWQELANRECVVLLHPTSPVGWEANAMDQPRPMAEFLFDTARVVLALAMRGVLGRHRRLRLVVPHSGSLVPMLVDRAALFQLGQRLALSPDDPAHGEPGVTDVLGDLWWDLSGTPTATHLNAITDRWGAEQVVYGSDYCFTPPVAVDLQLGLLDDSWSTSSTGLSLPTWREKTTANAARLLRGASRSSRKPYA